MLGKLIKHEFRATRRIMLPLMALVLLLSVFAGFAACGLEDMSGINDMQFMRTLYFIIIFLLHYHDVVIEKRITFPSIHISPP